MRTTKQAIFSRLPFVLGSAAVYFMLVGIGARAQTALQTQELERLTYSVKGPFGAAPDLTRPVVIAEIP